MKTDDPRYEVTTFDVCVSGFERLRRRDEFILLANIDAETSAADLLGQWRDDIQSCDRSDSFDYDAARAAVEAYHAEAIVPLFERANPLDLESNEDGEEGCFAYLYIRDCSDDEA